MYDRVRHRAGTQWSYLGTDGIPKTIIRVYAFWCRDTGKCIYVGQAPRERIRERLLRHWRGPHSPLLKPRGVLLIIRISPGDLLVRTTVRPANVWTNRACYEVSEHYRIMSARGCSDSGAL